MTQPVDWQTAGFSQVVQRRETEKGLHSMGIQTGPSLGRQDPYGKSELFTHSASFLLFKMSVYTGFSLGKTMPPPQAPSQTPEIQANAPWQNFRGNLHEGDVHGNSSNHH